jgi:hypothetical protein
MVADPLAGPQAGPQGFVQSARMPRVEVFATGRLAQCRLASAGGETPRIPLGQLSVNQEAQALFETAGRDVWQGQLRAQGLCHPVQAEGLEFVQRRMRAHEGSPLSSA